VAAKITSQWLMKSGEHDISAPRDAQPIVSSIAVDGSVVIGFMADETEELVKRRFMVCDKLPDSVSGMPVLVGTTTVVAIHVTPPLPAQVWAPPQITPYQGVGPNLSFTITVPPSAVPTVQLMALGMLFVFEIRPNGSQK
jgi:hypothetical protein